MSYWAELAAPELRDLAGTGAIALWPLGSTEQHGDHLVTGFDLQSAEAVCVRAASALEPTGVVLPGQPIGASEHWLPLGATLSIRPTTLSHYALDVVRSVGEAGFERLVIVNGHAGNVGPVLSALGEFRGDTPKAELVSYWDLVDPDAIRSSCATDAGGIGHAGEIETSIGLYLDNGLTIHDRLPAPPGISLNEGIPGSRRPVFLRSPQPDRESPSGVYGDPSHANPELGKLVIESASRRLAEHCRALNAPST